MEELWETHNKIRSVCIHNKLNVDELYSVGIDGLPSTEDEDLPQPVRFWVHGKSTKGKADYPVQSKGQSKGTFKAGNAATSEAVVDLQRQEVCQTCTRLCQLGQIVLSETVPNAETLVENSVNSFLKHHPEHVN